MELTDLQKSILKYLCCANNTNYEEALNFITKFVKLYHENTDCS